MDDVLFEDVSSGAVLAAFQRAAAEVPAYQQLLKENDASPGEIVDLASFAARAPLLSKANTFQRFPIEQLCAGGCLGDLSSVLTSSGHGGRFSFGLNLRRDAALETSFADDALDAAFSIRRRRTLALNCLPMGVGFTSDAMTIATVSVREDMAVALVQAFGHHFDQILLIGDPLFLTRLMQFASETGLEWRRYRMHAAIGEEITGEHFRDYLASSLGLDPDVPERGYIMSSFGVGELGLHLCYETPATIAVRRVAFRQPRSRGLLLGVEDSSPDLPMLFAYNPERTFIEVLHPDDRGYGTLAFSMLDPRLALPLLRYQTGDVGKLVDTNTLQERLQGTFDAKLPTHLVALQGRSKERLPNRSHVAVYKDALYADLDVARRVTGAFRLEFAAAPPTFHVQLAKGVASSDELSSRLMAMLPNEARTVRLQLWQHALFPYGMNLDYERKFAYYEPATSSL